MKFNINKMLNLFSTEIKKDTNLKQRYYHIFIESFHFEMRLDSFAFADWAEARGTKLFGDRARQLGKALLINEIIKNEI